ncbi:MAG: hypothetical protein QXW10_01240 [Candidatus Micrarchaeaceae archaeon]
MVHTIGAHESRRNSRTGGKERTRRGNRIQSTAEAKMEELDRFTYTVESKGKSLKLNITLFMHITDEKPEIRFCNEHTEYRYIGIEILANPDKMFLYSHARGVSDFTPIDLKIINEYMPKAYETYKAKVNLRAKSIA